MVANANASSVVGAKLPSQKGVGFVNVRSYVETKHGPEKWNEVLARLSESDRDVVASAVAVGWYEVRLFSRFLRAVDAVCGRGDLRLMGEVGAWEAEQDFNRVLRVFLKILTPPQVFKAEARLWKHFQDSGRWVMTPVDGGMNGELVDWEVDDALCQELSGYLVRLIQYTGGKDVVVRHGQCRARGAKTCLFEYRWK